MVSRLNCRWFPTLLQCRTKTRHREHLTIKEKKRRYSFTSSQWSKFHRVLRILQEKKRMSEKRGSTLHA